MCESSGAWRVKRRECVFVCVDIIPNAEHKMAPVRGHGKVLGAGLRVTKGAANRYITYLRV